MTPTKRRRGVTAIEYGLIAAGIIVAAIVAISLTGIRLQAVFGDAGNVLGSTVSPNTNGNTKFCSKSSIDSIGLYNNYGRPWIYPYDSCGYSGLSAPGGTLTCSSQWAGGGGCVGIQYQTASGKNVLYAEMIYYSNAGNNGASGTLFQDGFSFTAPYASNLGMSYAQFSTECSNGTFSAFRNDANSNTAKYGPGTPSKDASGDYVCSGAKITSGSL